mgnify:CR=1 FL=1
MSLFLDPAYADLTDEQRDAVMDRRADHTPDVWLQAFPATYYRLACNARADELRVTSVLYPRRGDSQVNRKQAA